MHPPALLAVAVVAAAANGAASLTLLSDLPTPSFIVDLPALLRRRVGPPIADNRDALFAPPIRCPDNGLELRPSLMMQPQGSTEDAPAAAVDCNFQMVEGEPAIGYLHASVVRAREEAVAGEDDPLSTFLAELDLDPALCGGDAQLVLGLNNHHVGSYYWARSAGAGASMEAPGVGFSSDGNKDDGCRQGVLRWLDEGGPTACNSNDGKRSEWANFLRRGDTVQLVPADGQAALLQFCKRCGEQKGKETSVDHASLQVYGISAEGRPMGSEPAVVCEYRLHSEK
ncbi:hypothetical protein ACHAXT_004333 [Thalassiosira profunda]